jgi:hypothetical protein
VNTKDIICLGVPVAMNFWMNPCASAGDSPQVMKASIHAVMATAVAGAQPVSRPALRSTLSFQ